MKYFIYPILWLIIFFGVIGLILVGLFTAVNWVFESITDWLYWATDQLYLKYCDLNVKILNKK